MIRVNEGIVAMKYSANLAAMIFQHEHLMYYIYVTLATTPVKEMLE